jgi:hypothetical protein
MKKSYLFAITLAAMAATSQALAVVNDAPIIELPETPREQVRVSAAVTADNFYTVYYGPEDGGFLAQVGRNERSAAGSAGGYNWSNAERFSFEMNAGDFLYVVAWDDRQHSAMWSGQFTLSDGRTIYSGSNWEYYVSQNASPFISSTGRSGELRDWIVGEDIWTATTGDLWQQASVTAPQGSSPWGKIPELNSQANFTWYERFNRPSPSGTEGNYVIFRLGLSPDFSPVPETSTYAAIVGVAGVVAGSWYRARRKAAKA